MEPTTVAACDAALADLRLMLRVAYDRLDMGAARALGDTVNHVPGSAVGVDEGEGGRAVNETIGHCSPAEVERLCEVMHDAYEAAAVGAGWETQQASRKPWADVPEANKATMRAAVSALLAALARS